MRFVFLIFFALLSSQAISSVQKFTLPNGLNVIVKEDHRAPVVVSMVWYKVGSADEPGGITGVSHALEHLMFKGTEKYPLGVFSKTVAAAGGQSNAFTNQDYTAYFEKLSASQLPTSFELEADRMQCLLFDKDAFAKEMKVIQEERRMRTDDNPQALAYERYLATAHLAEPYHHPVIGWMGDLKQMTVNDAKTWYQNFYAPNNATLVIVGDVNAEKVHKLAELYFGRLERKPNYIPKVQVEPPLLGKKSIEVHAPAKLPLYLFGYTVPSVKTAKNKDDPYIMEVISGILSTGDSSRFARKLIRGRHVAGSADSIYNPYTRFQTQFTLLGIPAAGHTIPELKEAMVQEIQLLQKEPVSEAELNRVKTQIIAQKTFEKDSIFGQAMELGILETVGLGWEVAEQYTNKIKAVTAAQVQEAAKKYFTDKAMTQTTLVPVSAKEPK
jgi:zinc protease